MTLLSGLPAFAPQSLNRLAGAIALAGSTTRTSSAIRAQAIARIGKGAASLTGPYTGAEAALIEVEITSATGASAVTTTPVFTGAGNGTLTGLTVAGAPPAQGFALTLKSLGTTTAYAGYDFGPAQIRAQTIGAGGNSITLTVDTSALTQTAIDVALLSDWQSGAASQSGDQWDFGGLPLNADGTLSTSTPVIQLGSDPQIFRPYKVFALGQWVHYLSPEPPRTLPRGTQVYTVGGSMSVTVDDGVTPETYPGITTLYSLLIAISAGALVEPASPAVIDTTPNGMAAQWLSLRTSPYVLPVISSGSRYANGLDAVSIGSAPFTQEVAIECVDNERIGQERWSVTGTVSGQIADAYTDLAYTSAAANFTVPLRPVETTGGSLNGELSGQYIPIDSASENRVCLRRPVVGALAQDKSVTFIWSARPTETCPCDTAPFTGEPSEECLGLPIPEAPAQEVGMDPAVQLRQDLITDWLATESVASVPISEIDTATDVWQVSAELREERLRKALSAVFLAALHEPTVATTPAALADWDTYFSSSAAPGVRFELAQVSGTSLALGEPVYRIHFVTAEAVPGTSLSTYTGWKIVETVGVKLRTFYKISATWSESQNLPFSGSAITMADIATAQIEVNRLMTVHSSLYTTHDAAIVARYEAAMNLVRSKAGIALGKPNASPTQPGGDCWQDNGDAFFWADPTGFYLPMFNAVYYVSSHRSENADGTSSIVSTKEFGFAPVAGCPDLLQEGDQLTITISGAGTSKTYQIGDKFTIPTINAGDAFLTGGITGNDTHTWGVVGTVAGPLADYAVIHGAELPYSAGGLGFTITRGGINNALADRWNFDVIGGQFRWRRDAGAWSAAADIDGSTTALGDGLNLAFTANKSPSFVAGDDFAWDVLQPYAVSEAADPSPDFGWQWIGASASLTADLGTAQLISAFGLVHRLPAGATLLLEGSSDNFATTDWSQALDAEPTVRLHMLTAPQTSRYVRLSAALATGGSILWAWAGDPLQLPPYESINVRRVYSRTQGGDLRKARGLRGQAHNAQVEFALLSPAELASLSGVLDALALDDTPLLFAPQIGSGYQLPHIFGQLGEGDIGEGLFIPGRSNIGFEVEGVLL
jgi:hypothetical protein